MSQSATARALVLEAARSLRLRELPIPEPAEDEGLLRVEACGLCGTDHEQYTGALPMRAPAVPGHEIVGVVERLGPRAAERWGVREGERVAVEVFQSCRRCGPCRSGEYRRCERHGLRDAHGFSPLRPGRELTGGYATHLHLAPDALLVPVPDSLDPVTATLFNPLGAGLRWGVAMSGVREGDAVAVLGPGIRGLSVLAGVRAAGAGYVLVTGAGARDRGRLELARRLGADRVCDVRAEDPVEAMRGDTGGGADVVVDVTAAAPEALAQALRLARPGGTVVVAGTRGKAGAPGFDPDLVVYKELRLLGAFGVDAAAYREAFALLESGRFPFDALPREVVGLEGAEPLLRSMAGEGEEPPPVHGVIRP